MQLIRLKYTPSTNDFLINYIKENQISEGCVVWTENQTRGRGQKENEWKTEPFKNLTFSILLLPNFLSIEQQAYLNMCVSLSIYDILNSELNIDHLYLKWPNDIFVKDKKMGGILIESALRKNNIIQSVVGIGINVNQREYDETLKNRSTSMALETNKKYHLKTLLTQIYNAIMLRYQKLKSFEFEQIKREYQSKLYRLNEEHFFSTSNGERFLGAIQGVNHIGQLIIRTSNQNRVFNNKEVIFEI